MSMTTLMPCGSAVIQKLLAAGIIPKNCTSFELVVKVNEPVRARCEVFVTEEQTAAILEALNENKDEAKRIIYDFCLSCFNDPKGAMVVDRVELSPTI
jgi:hypothetical protein